MVPVPVLNVNPGGSEPFSDQVIGSVPPAIDSDWLYVCATTPVARLEVIIDGAGFTVMGIFLVTVDPVPLSDNVIATVKLPETVGVPEMMPVPVLRDRPAGRDPINPTPGTAHVFTPVVPVDNSV